MRPWTKFAAALAVALLPYGASAATIGGAFYAVQYDFREFHQVTSGGKPFQVIVHGNPFPGQPEADAVRQLLPIMQANRPRSNVAFTYDAPVEPPRPYYRLYLISAPANDLNADGVCATGKVRHKEPTPGKLYLYAIYCRSDQLLSYTTGWTDAASPSDPSVGPLFRDLFATVFSDSPETRPNFGKGPFR